MVFSYSAAYVEVLKKEFSLNNYVEIGEFLGVAPSAITRYVQDPSYRAIDLIHKHLIKKGINVDEIADKVDKYVKKMEMLFTEEEFPYSDNSKTFLAYKDYEKVKQMQRETMIKRKETMQSKAERRANLKYADDTQPRSSPYSLLFQILFFENKDIIFEILNKKLHEEKNLTDADKIAFIEDFESLTEGLVTTTAKLKLLERLEDRHK